MRKLKNANIKHNTLDNSVSVIRNNCSFDDIQAFDYKGNKQIQIKKGNEKMIVEVVGIQYNPYGKTLFCVEKDETKTEFYAGRKVINAYCKDDVEVEIGDTKYANYYKKTKKYYIFN